MSIISKEQWSKCPQSMTGEPFGVYALWADCYALLSNPHWKRAAAGGLKEQLKRHSRAGSRFEREYAILCAKYLKMIRAPYAENRFETFYELFDSPHEEIPAIRHISAAEGRRYAKKNPLPIIHEPEYWTAVKVSLLRDTCLSLRAKGLLILVQRWMDLQGNCDDYTMTKQSIMHKEHIKRSSIDTAWAEAKAVGLLDGCSIVGDQGRFAWQYELPQAVVYGGQITGTVRVMGVGRRSRKRRSRYAAKRQRKAARRTMEPRRERAAEPTRAQVREQLMEQLQYDLLATQERTAPLYYRRSDLDGYISLMVDTACTGKDTVRIGGEDIPAGDVRDRLMAITGDELLAVMGAVAEQEGIRNPRAYKLTALYRAAQTVDAYQMGIVA